MQSKHSRGRLEPQGVNYGAAGDCSDFHFHFMKTQKHQERVRIDLDRITLFFGPMEPIAIPRRALRTRLDLLEWTYRLTGWPGMNLRRLRTFISALPRHHGGRVPEPDDFPLLPADNADPRVDKMQVSVPRWRSHRRARLPISNLTQLDNSMNKLNSNHQDNVIVHRYPSGVAARKTRRGYWIANFNDRSPQHEP